MNEEAIINSAKTTGGFLTPFGKTALYITLFFFVIIIIGAVSKCIAQDSLNPLLDDVVMRVLSVDYHLGKAVDNYYISDGVDYSHSLRDVFSGSWFAPNSVPKYFLWHHLSFWWDVLVCLWFIFVICYGLYLLVSTFNNSMVLRNMLIAIGILLLISFVVNIFYFYPGRITGMTISNDLGDVRSDMINYTHPLSGVRKFITFFIDRDYFASVYNFVDSPIGSFISNIPQYNETGAI